jgi:molybdate transport system regulatory protein
MLPLAYRIADSLLGRHWMEIKAKFWIENKGEVVLGGGKTAFLLAVDRLGSIQRAADEFGMSYRHAWGAIRRIEKRAGFKIVDTKLGGKEGGGARLTQQGKAFVEGVDFLLSDLSGMVEKRFKQKFKILPILFTKGGKGGMEVKR